MQSLKGSFLKNMEKEKDRCDLLPHLTKYENLYMRGCA